MHFPDSPGGFLPSCRGVLLLILRACRESQNMHNLAGSGASNQGFAERVLEQIRQTWPFVQWNAMHNSTYTEQNALGSETAKTELAVLCEG